MFNSIMLFILAGLAEIGGGYLVWLWLLRSLVNNNNEQR